MESINATSSPSEIWKTVRNMDGRRAPDRSNAVLEVDGVTYVEDKDKANDNDKDKDILKTQPKSNPRDL